MMPVWVALALWAASFITFAVSTAVVAGIVWIRRPSGSLSAAIADTCDEAQMLVLAVRDRERRNKHSRELRLAQRAWRRAKRVRADEVLRR